MTAASYDGVPGVGSDRTATPREVLMDLVTALFLPQGRIIDGSLSRDPLNTGDLDVLRAGMLMGKITASDKYAPSIIGTVGDAFLGTATTIRLLYAAEAAEITRRIGTTGTFKVTGPPVAGGRVRTRTLTYSAVGAGAGVNEVQTMTPDAAATAGTYRIKLAKPDGTFVWTAAIAWNATLAACQAAVTLALGAVAGWVCSSAGSAAPWSAGPIALVMTASGVGYTAHDYSMMEVEVTSLTGVTTITVVQTTRGCPVAATLTVTAPGLALTADVQTDTLNAAITAGTATFGIPRLDADLEWQGEYEWIVATWDTDWATTMTAWNVLAVARFGEAAVVMTGTATVPVFTFGGTYVGLPMPDVLTDLTGVTGPASWTLVHTTFGNSEGFIAGSLIQPTDGSETIRGMIFDQWGLKVTDDDAVSADVQLAKLLIGGLLDASQIINYPSDATLIAWLKAQLDARGRWTYDDSF